MRNTRKILVALVLVLAMMMSMATLFASAEGQPETLYLTPNANWKQDGARFAAYFFGNGEKWVSMTDADKDGVYEVAVPAGYPNVIFCRMNPSAAANNWNNKWNQTADLTVPTDGPNHYTVKEGTWDKGGGTWSTFGSTCAHTNLGEAATCTTPQTCLDCGDPVVSALGHTFNSAHLCTRCNEQASFTVAGDGAHLGTEWDTGNKANDMTYADGVYTKVYTNVAAGSYKFKVARDHDWGTAYPASDKAYTVATSGSTVTITLNGTTVNVVVEAPHVHSYFYPCDKVCQDCGELSNPDAAHAIVHVDAKAATCYENGNIEYWYCSDCGYAWADEALTLVTNQMSVVLPMAHAEATHVEAKAATCTENGNIEYWYCEACGQAWLDEACTLNTNLKAVILPIAEHTFEEGKCTACGAEDPDYVAPVANDKLINFSTWTPFAKETYADGDVYKLNDIFTFIMSKNSRVDESSKDWDDFSGTLRFSFGGKTPTGSVPSKNALQITADGAYTLKIWYVAGGDGRYFALMDSTGAVIEETTKETVKNGQGYAELTIPAAGVYYFGVPADNNYIFQLELVKLDTPVEPPHEHNFVDGKCECGEIDPDYVAPHVNTLVLGDTNKIVVSGNTLNEFGLPIEWVLFVADENAFYSFVGDNGALAFIFDANGGLISATGAANLEAGSYLICLGNGAVGEFNIAVTKSAWVNALALGANKLLITDVLDNGAGYYIVWVSFEVTEKANYTFTGEGILALVYDSAYAAVTGTELDVGTYNICVAFLTPATTGVATVNVEKTAIGGGDVVEPEYPALNLGDNTVVIDGSVLNPGQQPIAWLEFVVAEDGIYAITSADLNCYICADATFNNVLCGWTGTAELTAGTYYVAVGNGGITGEFTVKAEKLGDDVELPAVNTLVLGDNVYVLNQALKDKEFEFLYFTADKDGIYTFTGIDELIFFIWPDYPDQATVPNNAPYIWNVDPITGLLTDSVEVELVAATYLVGFRFVSDDGSVNPPVGEYPISVTFAEKTEDPGQQPGGEQPGGEQPGGEQPGEDKPQEEPELTLFQKILKAITDFFAKIGEYFKNLFNKKQ